ncbi:hypothetical protein Hamer_G003050, partial [Homarus americanus]
MHQECTTMSASSTAPGLKYTSAALWTQVTDGPMPELSPGDGSPVGRSVEVIPVLGVPAASGHLGGDQPTFPGRRHQPEVTSVGVSRTHNLVLKLVKWSRFLRNSRTIPQLRPWLEDRPPPDTLRTLESILLNFLMAGGRKMKNSRCACLIHMDLSYYERSLRTENWWDRV